MKESKQEEFISSSATKQHSDTSKKFIRTAEIKFRVKNVQKATINIEDIAAKHGGYVTYTNLQATNSYTSTTPISEDSVLETMYYTVVNDMVLRVPDHALDTAIREIALYIDFLNHRIIRARMLLFKSMPTGLHSSGLKSTRIGYVLQ